METELETMIDENGLQSVLDVVSQISYEKAEHLRANWQDSSAANQWDKAAGYVDKCSGYVGKLSL